jgi:hypothetical protein
MSTLSSAGLRATTRVWANARVGGVAWKRMRSIFMGTKVSPFMPCQLVHAGKAGNKV